VKTVLGYTRSGRPIYPIAGGAVPTKRKGVIAFAKQPAEGTPAAAPVYALPKNAGGMGDNRARETLPVTRPTAARPGRFVKTARGAGSVTVLAHTEALGLFLYEAMGAQSVTGTAPADHEFLMADEYPVPMTVWDLVGDRWMQFIDTFIAKLVIRGATTDLVYVTMDLLSKDYAAVAAPAYTLEPDEPRFKYTGSVVKLEADNAVPAEITTVNNVILTIDRAPEVHYGSRLGPQLIVPVRDVDFQAGMVVDTAQQGWDFHDVSAYGSVGGTEPTQDVGAGSFDVKFGRHPASASRYLSVVSNGANWEPEVPRPESDPRGGALEMDVAGIVRDPGAAGSEIEVHLLNERATVY
jgi:hypothetical protein